MCKSETDIEAIKNARAIMQYCCEHEKCAGCALRTGGGTCVLEKSLAADWELPTVKTYKEDFLSKFPNANFETGNLCRKMIYREKHDCCEVTCRESCQECWNEAYIEK